MANTNVSAFYEFVFKKIMLGVPSGYTTYNPTDAELADLWSDIMSVDVSGKMDLVPAATVANFAAFDAAGQVYDSLKNASSFAPLAHNHDTRYLRLDAINTYDATAATGFRFTWHVLDEAPFDIDNASGDILGVVTHLNADLLDGKHASEFAKQQHSHAAYVEIAGTHTITGTYTFDRAGTGVAPFAVAADNNGVVTNLNADLLDGNEAAAFAAAAHSHAWGTITGTLSAQTDLQAALDLKMDAPTTGVADGVILVWNDPVIQTSPINLSDLATTAQIALKYDEISAVNGNIAVFGSTGAVLADSGYAVSDFAGAAHTHDDRYFTETELTNYSQTLKLGQASEIDGAGLIIMGSNSSVGAGVTPSGTLEVSVNGVTFYLLTSASA